jgi:hypothetical protein
MLTEIGTHMIQIFWNNASGNYQSDIREFYIKTRPKYILTPENKLYSEPMEGYYPATFGFEDVNNDIKPSHVEYFAGGTTPDGPLSYAKVVEGHIDGSGNDHKKVLKLYDRTSQGTSHMNLNFSESGSEDFRDCTIEFWACNTHSGNYYHSYFEIIGNLGHIITWEWEAWGSSTNAPEIRVTNSSGEYFTGVYHEWDRWYRYSVDISCDGGYEGLGANQFRFKIYNETGDLIYTSFDMGLRTTHPTGGPFTFRILSTESQSDVSHYIDAFGTTGCEDNYKIGDNANKGLLLSIQETDEADWMGYSLDGEDNVSIDGNTTLIMPDDGSHEIQLYWNNSNGYFSTDIREFWIDCYTTILVIEFVDQLFTSEEFLIIFSVKSSLGIKINSASIDAWWNGDLVSGQVEKLEDDGMYQISLKPIIVLPGDPPILLRMVVSVEGYQQKEILAYISVDPELINKVSDNNLILILILTITGVSIASIAIVLSIGLIRTRSKRLENKRRRMTIEN